MIDEIVKRLLSVFGLREEDVEKVKQLLDKIDFTVKDGKKVMIVKIGDGIELTIVQKD